MALVNAVAKHEHRGPRGFRSSWTIIAGAASSWSASLIQDARADLRDRNSPQPDPGES